MAAMTVEITRTKRTAAYPHLLHVRDGPLFFFRERGEGLGNCQKKCPAKQKLLGKKSSLSLKKFSYTSYCPPIKIMHNIKVRIKFHFPEMPQENSVLFP